MSAHTTHYQQEENVIKTTMNKSERVNSSCKQLFLELLLYACDCFVQAQRNDLSCRYVIAQLQLYSHLVNYRKFIVESSIICYVRLYTLTLSPNFVMSITYRFFVCFLATEIAFSLSSTWF